jgi:dTDP-4-amino-4,6-dideoxygalactose transaminase
VEKRVNIANKYISALSQVNGLKLPQIKKGSKPSWVRFPIRVPNKIDFFRQLSGDGVDLAWTFSYSCADKYGEKMRLNSREAAEHVLDLPIYPAMSEHDIIKVIQKVKYAAK